jgi:hypothetical protein
MKKFISAVTALAMTATMVSVAPAAVNAASATRHFQSRHMIRLLTAHMLHLEIL